MSFVGGLLGLSVGVLAAATVVNAVGQMACKTCNQPLDNHQHAAKHYKESHPDHYKSMRQQSRPQRRPYFDSSVWRLG